MEHWIVMLVGCQWTGQGLLIFVTAEQDLPQDMDGVWGIHYVQCSWAVLGEVGVLMAMLHTLCRQSQHMIRAKAHLIDVSQSAESGITIWAHTQDSRETIGAILYAPISRQAGNYWYIIVIDDATKCEYRECRGVTRWSGLYTRFWRGSNDARQSKLNYRAKPKQARNAR